MWERGDKTNQGITEINASSIGMAKVHTHSHTHTDVKHNLSEIGCIGGMGLGRRSMEEKTPACVERERGGRTGAGRCLVTTATFAVPAVTFRRSGALQPDLQSQTLGSSKFKIINQLLYTRFKSCSWCLFNVFVLISI